MKEFIKMSKREILSFFMLSVFAGIMIGLGGTASLLAQINVEGVGRVVGAIMFSLGIYAIVIFDMKLFTGMTSDIPELGLKNSWRLALCFIGNTLGVLIVGVLVDFTALSSIKVLGTAIITQKLASDTWVVSTLCSSILCGILITLSVKSYKYTKTKGLSATIGVIFPIVVFAFCGFDHSVANTLYFFHYGEFSLQIASYVLLTILGNILGGVALPLVMKIKPKE